MRKFRYLIFLVSVLASTLVSCNDQSLEGMKIERVKGVQCVIFYFPQENQKQYVPVELYKSISNVLEKEAEVFNARSELTIADQDELYTLTEEINSFDSTSFIQKTMADIMTGTDSLYWMAMVKELEKPIMPLRELIIGVSNHKEEMDSYLFYSLYNENKEAVDIISLYFPHISLNFKNTIDFGITKLKTIISQDVIDDNDFINTSRELQKFNLFITKAQNDKQMQIIIDYNKKQGIDINITEGSGE